MRILELVFSPTGGTEQVAHILTEGLGGEPTFVDLSDAAVAFSAVSVAPEDVCVIAVPSFGGRVPFLAAERLKSIHGNGARAVLAVVYGNRALDDTLLELNDLALDAGFSPIAAVGAVAEHSIARQFGAGRPDETDRTELLSFAHQISAQLERNQAPTLRLPGSRPYRDYNGVPAKPVANDACTNCGLCATRCPAGAIPQDAPAQTDTARCISCMRCVSLCPNHARQVDPAVLAALTQKLAMVCDGRKKNTLYL